MVAARNSLKCLNRTHTRIVDNTRPISVDVLKHLLDLGLRLLLEASQAELNLIDGEDSITVLIQLLE